MTSIPISSATPYGPMEAFCVSPIVVTRSNHKNRPINPQNTNSRRVRCKFFGESNSVWHWFSDFGLSDATIFMLIFQFCFPEKKLSKLDVDEAIQVVHYCWNLQVLNVKIQQFLRAMTQIYDITAIKSWCIGGNHPHLETPSVKTVNWF